MIPTDIIDIAAFICGLACAAMSTFVVFQIVDKVNDRLPRERHFSHLWWNWSKYERVFAEYKRLYPDGGLVRMFLVLGALLFACFFVGAWGSGFFSR